MIFSGQSYVRLNVYTGLDLSTATVRGIRYEKPSGVSGFWTASSFNATTIIYEVQVGDIDEHGTWHLQSHVEIGGSVALGTIVKFIVKEAL